MRLIWVLIFILLTFNCLKAQVIDTTTIDTSIAIRELPKFDIYNIEKKEFFASINLGAGIPTGAFVEGIDYEVLNTTPQLIIKRRPMTGLYFAAKFDKRWWKYIGMSVSTSIIYNASDDNLNRQLEYKDRGYLFATASAGLFLTYSFVERSAVYIRIQGGIAYSKFTKANFELVLAQTGLPVLIELSSVDDWSYLVNVSGGVRFLMSNTVTMNLEFGYQYSNFIFEGVNTTITPINQPPIQLQSNNFKLNYQQIIFAIGVGIAF